MLNCQYYIVNKAHTATTFMWYNVNKGTLAVTVYVFYGYVCHGVLPTAALYHLLKLRKMGAGGSVSMSSTGLHF